MESKDSVIKTKINEDEKFNLRKKSFSVKALLNVIKYSLEGLAHFYVAY